MRYIAILFFVLSAFPEIAMARGDVKNPIENPIKESPNLAGKEGTRKEGRPTDGALDEKGMEFVRTNLVSTIYHEMAHALIDFMDLPVFGQQEDAADVFSVVMVEMMHSSDEALIINRGAAHGFKVDDLARRKKGRDWDWADEHGPDMQRYFNIVCLTYGAHPEEREAFAKEMDLPGFRAENCADEYEMALDSWGPVIETIMDGSGNRDVTFQNSSRSSVQVKAAEIVEAEIFKLNRMVKLRKQLRVSVKRCGRDSNFYAFYSPGRNRITICTNYIDELYRNGKKPDM
jgi:hypothetical protein